MQKGSSRMDQELSEVNQYQVVAFALNEQQVDRLNEWIRGVHVRAAEKQKTTQSDTAVPSPPRLPYYGAIGGGYTFSFVVTSLGIVCKVREAITGEELDLTDYDEW